MNMTPQTPSLAAFQGKRILIIEDEFFVAYDLQFELEQLGVEVIGPISTLAEATKVAEHENIDAAVVDVDLHGQQSFPAADILVKRGTPFVFHTGTVDREVFEKDYPNTPIMEKPSATSDIINTLLRLTQTA
jgi:CheY-like chemotaxis protein